MLAGQVQRLVGLLHRVAAVMGLPASVLVREALLSCVLLPDAQHPGGSQEAATPLPVMWSIAEWYMTTVVKDHRNIGVSISKAR